MEGDYTIALYLLMMEMEGSWLDLSEHAGRDCGTLAEKGFLQGLEAFQDMVTVIAVHQTLEASHFIFTSRIQLVAS